MDFNFKIFCHTFPMLEVPQPVERPAVRAVPGRER